MEKEYKLGDTIKPKGSRRECKIVSIFEDNEQTFYVAKTKINGVVCYSNIFTYDNEGNLFKRL